VRTKTLVKSAVVQIDAAPFRAWYMQHYGKKIGIKEKNGEKVESVDITDVKRSNTLATKLKKRNAKHEVALNIDEQFATGRLYALVTSRPGQCGRCDGYVLEGKELEFYLKKMTKKKKGESAAQ
jgi:small subunit ribosomal protein S8e